jgi:hypothetical protein
MGVNMHLTFIIQTGLHNVEKSIWSHRFSLGIIFAKLVFNRRMFNSLFLEKATYSWMTIVTTLYIVDLFNLVALVSGRLHALPG